jgi:hypothetical protein
MIRAALTAAAAFAFAAGAALAQPAAPAGSTVGAPVSNPGNPPKLLHVYADARGETHLEVITVSPKAGVLPLTGLNAITYQPNKVNWHHAPTPQFAINLTGYLQVEVSDGTRHRIGPGDLVFLDDTTGKGHVTRLLSPVTALFIHPAKGFDIHKWAAGEK